MPHRMSERMSEIMAGYNVWWQGWLKVNCFSHSLLSGSASLDLTTPQFLERSCSQFCRFCFCFLIWFLRPSGFQTSSLGVSHVRIVLLLFLLDASFSISDFVVFVSLFFQSFSFVLISSACPFLSVPPPIDSTRVLVAPFLHVLSYINMIRTKPSLWPDTLWKFQALLQICYSALVHKLGQRCPKLFFAIGDHVPLQSAAIHDAGSYISIHPAVDNRSPNVHICQPCEVVQKHSCHACHAQPLSGKPERRP